MEHRPLSELGSVADLKISEHVKAPVLSKRELNTELRRAYEEGLTKHPTDHAMRRDYARWLSTNGALDNALVEWKKIEAQSTDTFLKNFAVREIKRLETQKLFKQASD